MPDVIQDSLIIRIPAILRANGVDMSCFVEIQHGQNCTECRLLDAPPQLADGEYMVEFAEQSLPASKHQGKWGVLCLAPEMQITEAA